MYNSTFYLSPPTSSSGVINVPVELLMEEFLRSDLGKASLYGHAKENRVLRYEKGVSTNGVSTPV